MVTRKPGVSSRYKARLKRMPAANTCAGQTYHYPAALFSAAETEAPAWICVRTRPRWEKRFGEWLSGHQIPYYLPTCKRTSISHRKRRISQIPLFAGYIFVAGHYTKQDFAKSDCVVRILQPTCSQEANALHAQLANLWLAEESGFPMSPIAMPEKGQRVEVREGPLKGIVGVYQKKGREGSLVLLVDMLGVAVTVEIDREYRHQIL